MKKKLVGLIPYIIVLAVEFYLFPGLIKDTGAAMLLMLCIMPLIVFVSSLIYGVRYGFNILLPLIVVLLFFPTIFIFYNESAWIYLIIYGVVAVAANVIGRVFCKKR